MHVDWFLVGLAIVTIPLAAWGYWIVTSDGDPGNGKDRDGAG